MIQVERDDISDISDISDRNESKWYDISYDRNDISGKVHSHEHRLNECNMFGISIFF